jgi:hypothetical protein
LGSFSCICPIEYTGTLCNQLKDSCAILPCSNGGTCINMVTDYSCLCVPGYTNKNCTSQINNCVLSYVCLNGGTCVNQVNSYTCTCPIGFTGSKCDLNSTLNASNNPTPESLTSSTSGVFYFNYLQWLSIFIL